MSDWNDMHETNGTDDLRGEARTPGGWTHPVNVGHLVMGIAFLGLVLIWALIVGGTVSGDDIRWLMPIPWVAAGGAGLVAMALTARRRS